MCYLYGGTVVEQRHIRDYVAVVKTCGHDSEQKQYGVESVHGSGPGIVGYGLEDVEHETQPAAP